MERSFIRFVAIFGILVMLILAVLMGTDAEAGAIPAPSQVTITEVPGMPKITPDYVKNLCPGLQATIFQFAELMERKAKKNVSGYEEWYSINVDGFVMDMLLMNTPREAGILPEINISFTYWQQNNVVALVDTGGNGITALKDVKGKDMDMLTVQLNGKYIARFEEAGATIDDEKKQVAAFMFDGRWTKITDEHQKRMIFLQYLNELEMEWLKKAIAVLRELPDRENA